MKAISSSETSVDFQRRYVPEERTLKQRCVNVSSRFLHLEHFQCQNCADFKGWLSCTCVVHKPKRQLTVPVGMAGVIGLPKLAELESKLAEERRAP
jgi:hypothetical protein